MQLNFTNKIENSKGGVGWNAPGLGRPVACIENPSDYCITRLIYMTDCLLFHMCTENLALLQSTWQSGTWRSNTGAERAVDGLYTNLREWGGECAASSLRQTATEWRVDLGGEQSLHHIVIQYATGNIAWGTVWFKTYNYMIYCC